MSIATWVLLLSASFFGLLALVPRAARRPSRAFPDSVRAEILQLPERRPNQHVVDLELADGRMIRKVWVAWGQYPAIIGGRTLLARYRPRDTLHAVAHADSN